MVCPATLWNDQFYKKMPKEEQDKRDSEIYFLRTVEKFNYDKIGRIYNITGARVKAILDRIDVEGLRT